MRAAAALAPPSPGAWRVLHRRARRLHHPRSIGELLSDLYMLLWIVLVYGGALVAGVRRHLEATAGSGAVPAQTWWMVAASLPAAAGLAWMALRALGPMVATPAEQVWAIATPMDRRTWLLPRFASLAATGAAVGAVLGVAAALASSSTPALGWAALTGAGCGAACVSALVAAQASTSRRRDGAPLWASVTGRLLLVGGAAMVLAIVTFHERGRALPSPTDLPIPSLAGLALVAAGAAGALAVRSLSRLALTSLNAGAQIASATLTATVWIDPSLLSRVLEVRRWRTVGTVRSRPFRAGWSSRTSALLQAEWRRQLRRPGALAVWAGLALAVHAAALVAPTVLGVARILLGYLAAGRLMSGLRALSGSPGLQRALGGSQQEQRVAHLAVPALGTAIWWAATATAATATTAGAATAAAVPAPIGALDVLLVAGIVGAAYRASTRPPMSYGGAVFETPLGLFPMELMLQLSRGLDLLGVTMVLEILVRG